MAIPIKNIYYEPFLLQRYGKMARIKPFSSSGLMIQNEQSWALKVKTSSLVSLLVIWTIALEMSIVLKRKRVFL